MAGLPAADQAVIDDRKITAYLLSDNHPAGRSKAAFFRQFGFRARSWRRLRDALLEHGRVSPVIGMFETQFGRKYILQGPIRTTDGRASIWFVDEDEPAPRLVTAYRALGARA